MAHYLQLMVLTDKGRKKFNENPTDKGQVG